MIKRWGVLAAATLALTVGATVASAAPVTIDFGGSAGADDQPSVRVFAFDGVVEASSPSDGVTADFMQVPSETSVVGALPTTLNLGGIQGFAARSADQVGTSASSSKGNFFDASSALDVGGGSSGLMAASGNLDGGGFGGFSVGISSGVPVPLPRSAAMGLGLLAALGGLSAWRRRRRTSDLA